MNIEFQVNRTRSFESISFGRTSRLSLKTYYTKHLTSLSSVSIVNRRHLLLPIFRAPHKQKELRKKREKRKYKKNQNMLEESKKTIYQLRRTYQNVKEIAKDWLRTIKIYKF